jgi:hypothetical protein
MAFDPEHDRAPEPLPEHLRDPFLALPGTPEAEEELRFCAWMRQVDRAMTALCGFSSDDLPDYLYRDAFRSRRNPLSVAKSAIRAARNEGC